MKSLPATEFIGREEEFAFLKKWLTDREAPSIVYIHDALEEKDKKGGIGKTWLLRRFYEMVQSHVNSIAVIVDFFNVLDRNSVVIAERVVQAVKEKYPRWKAESFERLHQQYIEAARGQKTRMLIPRDRLADALADDLRLLQQQMVDNDIYIILFFDTYELIELNPITAVLRPTQTFPDNYQSNRIRSIIAGRNAIDWKHQNWVGREKEVIVRALQPFNEREALQYLDNRSRSYEIDSFPEETLKALYYKTDGRPILVGLVSDVLNKRIKDAKTLAAFDRRKFEASLVEEINHFDDPSKCAIFSMAHIYHRFDVSFLSQLMNWPGLRGLVPEIEYQDLVLALPTLSFVRSTEDGEVFVLHDEMRRLINKYCWEVHDQDGRIRRELSMLAVDYYTMLIAKEEDEEKRQSYIVEKLFHELFLDVEAGFQSFERHLNDALKLSLRTFARALFQELQKFEPRFSYEQRQAMKFAEVRVLREEEDPGAALSVLDSLDQFSEWAQRHRSDLLFERGNCHRQLSQYNDAIEYFKSCLSTEEGNTDKTRLGLLLNNLGYINRLKGENDEAMSYYQKALEVQRTVDNPSEYANLLNNMGNVLRLQDKLEDALRYCKLALHIRRDLVKQKKISEYFVGLSLSTLGLIYHDLGKAREEEQAFQEAFNIYNLTGEKSAIANTHNRLGRIWVEKRDFERARKEFQQALRIATNSPGVIRETEIESYNQLGRLSLLEEEWEEAVTFFEKAVTRARQVGQKRDLAENLLFLADALDHLGLSSSEQIEEAKSIAYEGKDVSLKGRVQEEQGDILLRKQEYLHAFVHYRVACHDMALQGSQEYERIMRKVNDILLEIPEKFLSSVLDVLLSYWYEMDLDKTYPAVIEMCREISNYKLP